MIALSHAYWGSVVSGFSFGSCVQSNVSPVTDGGSNSNDVAEVCAMPACIEPTTSRSTPSSCTRSSSAETKRSAGSAAQHLSSSRNSESYSANSGISSTRGSVNS